MHCQKCSGEGRVMVQDEGIHWHWEACPECNGFEDMASSVAAADRRSSPWTFAVDAEINNDLHDNLPW